MARQPVDTRITPELLQPQAAPTDPYVQPGPSALRDFADSLAKLDRPLKQLSDFIRFAGERVEIKLREAVDNRKVYVGTLCLPEGVAVADITAASHFGLEFEDQSGKTQLLNFTFGDTDRAKLDPILDFKGKKR